MNPGVTVAPAALITRVRAVARLRRSALGPTARNVPSFTAKASARRWRSSMVYTRALTTTKSASTPGPAAGACATEDGDAPREANEADGPDPFRPVTPAPANAAPKPRNSPRVIFAMRLTGYVC